MNDYQNIINELTADCDFYQEWFDSATETQSNMIWEAVWNQAAEKHSENDFIQGLYDFYQMRGYLTHRQWCFLIKTIQPSMFKIRSLKDRLK